MEFKTTSNHKRQKRHKRVHSIEMTSNTTYTIAAIADSDSPFKAVSNSNVNYDVEYFYDDLSAYDTAYTKHTAVYSPVMSESDLRLSSYHQRSVCDEWTWKNVIDLNKTESDYDMDVETDYVFKLNNYEICYDSSNFLEVNRMR